MSNVVWHNDTHLIMQTAEADGALMPEGLFQIYERRPGTDEWERLPKGGVSSGITWYKTLEAAKEAALAHPNTTGGEEDDK